MNDILSQIGEFMAAFKPGFSSVYSIWGTVVSVLLFYKTIYTIIGAFCTRKFEPAQNMHKYGIVIAARNEKNVIGNLLDSISKQDYPLEYVTVFVVADNCTDDGETARIAREHGAVVYERFDSEHATKGYALQFLFNNIEKDYGTQSFEGFFVFDADNLLKSDYISRMNDAFDAGEKIITSYRNSKNIDENWIASTYAIHWLRSVRQSHRARSVFRLATNIQGTGFLFTSEIVKNGWKYTSLTEDRALTADAVVQGYQITYNDAAEFYDEQPTKIKIALRQRTRWAKGHIMAFTESGFGLFKNIFTYKGKNFLDTVRQRFASYDMLILVCPRPLFIIAKKIIKALVFLLAYTASANFWLWTAVYFYTIFTYKVTYWIKNMMIAAYIFVFESKRIKKISFWNKAKFTLAWPLFDIIGKYAMYVALFMDVKWKPIPHDSKVTIDDISKSKGTTAPAFLQKSGEYGITRFMTHCAFAALSCLYSVFILNINTKIFCVFVLVNLALIGIHALIDLKDSSPRWAGALIVCLTFVWNITMCCEVLGNGAISYVLSLRMVLNLLLYAAPYILVYTLSGSIKVSSIATAVFWFATSSANMFLTEMRGRPLFLSDLFSIGTAINVANQYKVDITTFYVFTLVYIGVMIAYFCLLEHMHEPKHYKFKWYTRYSINLPILIVVVLMMSSSSFLTRMGVTPYFWSHKVNGFPLNFVMDLQHSSMNRPEGYSIETLTEISDNYPEEKALINQYDAQDRPNVIVIMDESYSDLRLIGDFDTNIDVTPFMDKLCEDKSVVSGYTYASVFGGGTADSEYEFLTGDSMFLYPQGAVPYQTNFKNVSYMPSIVTTFNSLGYKTVATHPYLSSGWNRPIVYTALGFDVQEYIEEYKDASYYRAYITDDSDFDNLVKLYEEKDDGEPLFVFNITMQNHGGYTTKYSNFNQKIELRNTQGDYPMAEQYLSLIHETDIALQKLINYFENASEPTVIMFFGDHQVQLEDEFYEELYGKDSESLTEAELMQKYVTRFFIWSNYDLNTPSGYSDLTALSGRIKEKLEESDIEPSPIIDSSGSSGVAGSDVVESDVTESGSSDNTESEVQETAHKVLPKSGNKLEQVYDDTSDSDVASSDMAVSDTVVPSDETGSDVTGSDSEDDVFVTQKHITVPQTTTSISHLSTLLFEVAGLPRSSYQRYLSQLRSEYPAINIFGVIETDGTYTPIGSGEGSMRENLSLYEYAIYNRMFDKTDRFDSLFCIQQDDVTFVGDAVDKFSSRLLRWIDGTNRADTWYEDMQESINKFMRNSK